MALTIIAWATIIAFTVTTNTATAKPIYDAKSYDPQNSIGSLFGKVKGAIGAAYEAELAPLDITAAQYVILMSLAQGEVSSASDLCKGISYDPGAMTRMLDRLERRGLVRRVPNPDDRRAFQLELTEEGTAVVPKLRTAGMKALNKMLDGFSTQRKCSNSKVSCCAYSTTRDFFCNDCCLGI